MKFDANELMDKYLPLFMDYGIKIITALLIFFIGKWLAKIVTEFLELQMRRRNIDPMITNFAKSLIYWALFVFVSISALAQIGVQTASLVAIVGAAGLAVGLALQGSLSNFAAGVLILIFRPFKIGDFIEAAGQSGVVGEIKMFSTHITTGDNKEIIIPNSAIMNGSIVNFSAKEKRRVDLLIGVSYDAYLPDVKKLLEEIIAADPQVLQEENNMVAVSAMADSSVNLVVRAWTKTPDYWAVYFRLTETIKLKLDEAGIAIPYPQMDVHLNQISQ